MNETRTAKLLRVLHKWLLRRYQTPQHNYNSTEKP